MVVLALWEDFVKFQAEARKARLLERNERIKKINQRWHYASLIVAGCNWTHRCVRYLCDSQCGIKRVKEIQC
jgi:hypothetical protein